MLCYLSKYSSFFKMNINNKKMSSCHYLIYRSILTYGIAFNGFLGPEYSEVVYHSSAAARELCSFPKATQVLWLFSHKAQ